MHSTLWLPVEPRAVGIARRAVRLRCGQWKVPHLYETTVACVSELVTNAIRHAKWPDGSRQHIRFSMSVERMCLVVGVSDPDSAMPTIGSLMSWTDFDWIEEGATKRGEGGMGLYLVVSQIDEHSGVFRVVFDDDGGKTVGFSLPI